jgi:hypothetical protein
MFSTHGEDEYIVVAKRVTPQLRRKSTKMAGVLDAKIRVLDCMTDHSSMLSY